MFYCSPFLIETICKIMSTKTSSYQYDLLDERVQDEEFKRLQRQASGLLQIENRIWSEIGFFPGATVLDVGCGSGMVTQALAECVYPGHVVGVDVSEALIERGQQAYRKTWKNSDEQRTRYFRLRQGDAYNLPFPANSFDVVHARFVMQHLSEPTQALKEIRRVLKPDGLVCLIDVDKGWSGLYPEPETSTELDEAIIQKQLSQGGDPWVGRKLSWHLNNTGFSKSKTDIKLVDSDQIGFSKFLEMLAFGKCNKGGSDEISTLREKAQPDIADLMNSPYVWSGFALFVATGRK